MSEERKCPTCEDPLTLLATHTYEIYQSEEGNWCKDTGTVMYQCNNCGTVFQVNEIKDILLLVDEL